MSSLAIYDLCTLLGKKWWSVFSLVSVCSELENEYILWTSVATGWKSKNVLNLIHKSNTVKKTTKSATCAWFNVEKTTKSVTCVWFNVKKKAKSVTCVWFNVEKTTKSVTCVWFSVKKTAKSVTSVWFNVKKEKKPVAWRPSGFWLMIDLIGSMLRKQPRAGRASGSMLRKQPRAWRPSGSMLRKHNQERDKYLVQC